MSKFRVEASSGDLGYPMLLLQGYAVLWDEGQYLQIPIRPLMSIPS